MPQRYTKVNFKKILLCQSRTKDIQNPVQLA